MHDPMNIVIIEDEKLLAEQLERLILKIEPSAVILEKLGSIEDSINWLKTNEADLIFLDIHLSDGLSFKIFEKIKISTPIIFTTAYDQYAIKAFKLNSIDYLLKPIDEDELKESLVKFKSFSKSQNMVDINQLLSIMDKPEVDYKKRFMVYAGQKVKSIKTEEVAYFYVMEKNVFLCTKNNENYDVDFSLDKLEAVLEPSVFFRINRRYIVNIECIKNMYPLSNSRIKIELNPLPDEETIVSLHRSRNFKNWLNQ